MQTQEVNDGLRHVKIFKGTFPRDKVPKINQRPAAFVVNTDSAKEPGEHWVSILLLPNGRGEYFDSFGLAPLHMDYIEYLDTNCPNGWVWNNIGLQDPGDTTCGNFCQKYVKARAAGLGFVEFLLSDPQAIVQNHF